MWAAARGQVDAVKTLIERGADMNMLDEVIMYIMLCGCNYMYMTMCVCIGQHKFLFLWYSHTFSYLLHLHTEWSVSPRLC